MLTRSDYRNVRDFGALRGWGWEVFVNVTNPILLIIKQAKPIHYSTVDRRIHTIVYTESYDVFLVHVRVDPTPGGLSRGSRVICPFVSVLRSPYN